MYVWPYTAVKDGNVRLETEYLGACYQFFFSKIVMGNSSAALSVQRSNVAKAMSVRRWAPSNVMWAAS